MNNFEITVKVYLTKDILQEDCQQEISAILDKVLAENCDFLNFHKENYFKNYCFNSLYPLEKDKLYKEDNIYSFQIRTNNIELAEYLSINLKNTFSSSIKILKVDIRKIPTKHIDKIFSVTPIVIRTDNGYWKGVISLEDFERRIKENLIKKYNQITGEKIDEKFPLFVALELKNKKPIAIKLKGKTLLGDKISLKIADDELSQKIANLAIGSGIGEINARGYGYVNYRWL